LGNGSRSKSTERTVRQDKKRGFSFLLLSDAGIFVKFWPDIRFVTANRARISLVEVDQTDYIRKLAGFSKFWRDSLETA